MPVLGAKNLVKTIRERSILTGASVAIDAGERIGLVGINGSGKSTLARIVAGIDQPDAGELTRPRGLTLGYLAQDPDMPDDATAVQAALSGLADWSDAMHRYDAATADLERGDADALAAQTDAAAALERFGGWDVQHRAEAMLGHLGVSEPTQTVGTMSGGERRRVAMARVLVARPDIAILDEPTNHLDVGAIEWLEDYLINRFDGSLLLITHDRYLLDRVVTRTLELDHGELYSYAGGWDAYLTARAQRQAQEERVEANRRNFLRRELEWLRRQPKARTGKQKARIDRAHAAIDSDGPARDGRAAIAVGSSRTGKTILEVRDLVVDIAGQRVVDGLSLALRKGDRIGVIGPNGAGKTTLIRALLGKLEPAAGGATLGKNTLVAYLDQSRAGLVADKTVLDNVAEGRTHVTLGEHTMEVRTYLQRFLFTVPDQARIVRTLSGGERARVALARVLRDSANLVVLDEPTNDLDVTTLAALEASLLDFGGTALVVTHDRWFLDRVATAILSFEGDGRVVYVEGNYQHYLTWRDRDRADAEPARAAVRARAKPAPEPSPQPATKTLTYAERLELDALMERIDVAESEVAELQAALESAEFAAKDYTAQAAFLAQLADARARAEALVDRWTELESRRDS